MRARIIWPALAVSLAGCLHIPVTEDGLSYQQRRTQLEALQGWQMRGRIAVNTGKRAYQGRFDWRQNGDNLEFSIRGPMGAGIMQIRGPTDALTITTSGKTWQLENPEKDLSALLGWWLPVRSLRSWLIGIPDPSYTATETLGPANALASLNQRFWELHFTNYQLTAGLMLPSRVDLSHEKLQLRVIIDNWAPDTLN
ncbi:MAG: lipoprotein insertase outer membrane protein LolB [Gammaproteobacteria bacterium]